MLRRKQKLPERLPYVPTYQTVCAMTTLPPDVEETLAESAQLQAETMMPFEEGAYSFSYEVVRRGEEGLHVLMAGASNEMLATCGHDMLKLSGNLGKVRLDLSALGWARAVVTHWPELTEGLRPVLIRTEQEQVVLLLSDGVPVEVRGFAPDAPDALLARETTLALVRLNLAGEARSLGRGLCLAADPAQAEAFRAALGGEADFAPLTDAEALLQEGLRARLEEGTATFDLTPPEWIAEAKAIRQRQLLVYGGSVFAVVWVLCAAALFLLPRVYAKMADDAQAAYDAQHEAYLQVEQLRRQVNLVSAYGDRQYSSLEMLLLICECKAPNIVLKSFTYDRNKNGDFSVRISGLADAASNVYDLVNAVKKDPRIADVELGNPVTQLDRATNRQAFTLTLKPVLANAQEEGEE